MLPNRKKLDFFLILATVNEKLGSERWPQYTTSRGTKHCRNLVHRVLSLTHSRKHTGCLWSRGTPNLGAWQNLSLGRGSKVYSCSFLRKDGKASCELYDDKRFTSILQVINADVDANCIWPFEFRSFRKQYKWLQNTFFNKKLFIQNKVLSVINNVINMSLYQKWSTCCKTIPKFSANMIIWLKLTCLH